MAKRDGETEAKRRLEGVAGCVGAVLALATLGIIVWDGKTGGAAPPWSPWRRSPSIRTTAEFVLEVLARNEGGATAAQVVVEGELRRGGESVETSQTTFDYVPPRIAAARRPLLHRRPAATRDERARPRLHRAVMEALPRFHHARSSSARAAASPASAGRPSPSRTARSGCRRRSAGEQNHNAAAAESARTRREPRSTLRCVACAANIARFSSCSSGKSSTTISTAPGHGSKSCARRRPSGPAR